MDIDQMFYSDCYCFTCGHNAIQHLHPIVTGIGQ